MSDDSGGQRIKTRYLIIHVLNYLTLLSRPEIPEALKKIKNSVLE